MTILLNALQVGEVVELKEMTLNHLELDHLNYVSVGRVSL